MVYGFYDIPEVSRIGGSSDTLSSLLLVIVPARISPISARFFQYSRVLTFFLFHFLLDHRYKHVHRRQRLTEFIVQLSGKKGGIRGKNPFFQQLLYQPDIRPDRKSTDNGNESSNKIFCFGTK